MKLSVIIVNYNVTRLLRNCLLSIRKYIKETEYEVIVIDNASTDSSWGDLIPEFPEVRFMSSQTNGDFRKQIIKPYKRRRRVSIAFKP